MYLSNCCGSPALIQNGKEGTNHFLCSSCQKPCDAHEQDNQPQITKLSTTHQIVHKNKTIVVAKDEKGRLKIEPMGWVADKGFVFINSKPGTVRVIGELLIMASEI